MAYKLFDEGEQLFLDVTLRNNGAPAGFYLGLANVSGGVANMAETLTLGTLTGEATGGGYARKAIARSTSGWGAPALDAGDYQTSAVQQTWTASGSVLGPVNVAFLTTSSDNSGKLVAACDLSGPRTLQINDSLAVAYNMKMQ